MEHELEIKAVKNYLMFMWNAFTPERNKELIESFNQKSDSYYEHDYIWSKWMDASGNPATFWASIDSKLQAMYVSAAQEYYKK